MSKNKVLNPFAHDSGKAELPAERELAQVFNHKRKVYLGQHLMMLPDLTVSTVTVEHLEESFNLLVQNGKA